MNLKRPPPPENKKKKIFSLSSSWGKKNKNILQISKDPPLQKIKRRKYCFLLPEEIKRRRKIFDESQKAPTPVQRIIRKNIFYSSGRNKKKKKKM